MRRMLHTPISFRPNGWSEITCRGSLPRLGIGEKSVATMSESSSRDSARVCQCQNNDGHQFHTPLPITHRRIRPAQYS